MMIIMIQLSLLMSTVKGVESIRKKLVLTVHLSFIGKDDFPSSAGRINGQGFLKTLFDVRRPYSFSIGASIAHVITITWLFKRAIFTGSVIFVFRIRIEVVMMMARDRPYRGLPSIRSHVRQEGWWHKTEDLLLKFWLVVQDEPPSSVAETGIPVVEERTFYTTRNYSSLPIDSSDISCPQTILCWDHKFFPKYHSTLQQ